MQALVFLPQRIGEAVVQGVDLPFQPLFQQPAGAGSGGSGAHTQLLRRRAHLFRLFFEHVAVFVLIAQHLFFVAAAHVGDGTADGVALAALDEDEAEHLFLFGGAEGAHPLGAQLRAFQQALGGGVFRAQQAVIVVAHAAARAAVLFAVAREQLGQRLALLPARRDVPDQRLRLCPGIPVDLFHGLTPPKLLRGRLCPRGYDIDIVLFFYSYNTIFFS